MEFGWANRLCSADENFVAMHFSMPLRMSYLLDGQRLGAISQLAKLLFKSFNKLR
jgi:hypothetical protein